MSADSGRSVHWDATSLAEYAFAILAVAYMTQGLNLLIDARAIAEVAEEGTSPRTQQFGALIYAICGALIALRFKVYVPLALRNFLIFLPIGLAFLSIFWSVSPDLTLRRSIALLGTVLVGFYIGARFNLREMALVLFGGLALIVVASVAMVALIPSRGIHQASDQMFLDHVGLWRGTFAHKNSMGPVASMAFFITLALWRTIPLPAVAKGSVAAMALLLVVKAGSAQAVGQLLVFSTAVVLHRRVMSVDFYTRVALIAFGAGFGVFLFVFAELLFVAFVEALGRTPDLSGRTPIWQAAWMAGQERPWFGGGYSVGWSAGANRIAERLIWNDPGNAHNGFLAMWLDLGLVGLALVMLVWISLISRIVRIQTIDNNFFIFGLYFFLFYLTTNFVESYLYRHLTIQLAILVILVVGLERAARRSAVATRRSPAPRRLRIAQSPLLESAGRSPLARPQPGAGE
jgi:O-antigen ligase